MKDTTSTVRYHTVAILLVLFGAIGYSSKAIFIKLAYQYEVDSISLVALRMAFSLPFFLLVAWYDHRKRREETEQFRLSRRHLLHIVLLGFLGYYLASVFDFLSLQYLTASLARLILFTYPTLVLLLSALFLRRPIHRVEVGAVLLSYVGIAFAFSNALELETGEHFWRGVALSVGSALSFACYLIGSGEYLPKLGTIRYNSLTMSIACVAIIVHHGIQHQWALFDFAPPVYAYCVGIALLATVIPSFMVAEGIRRLGAGPASIISSIGPISTILLAAIFLGEVFSTWQWLGAVLVIGGVFLLSWWKRKHSAG
ncbi:MAG: DMT family transporter [Bacteroidota bacterium]